VADEIDADWKRVQIIQAPGDLKYGSQDTDGSCSANSAATTAKIERFTPTSAAQAIST
jgi:hypothetical protein